MYKELPCLPLIQERFLNCIGSELKFQETKYPDFELTVFQQTWGSTALGFGGIGGCAMTDAYTTVIWENNSKIAGVFFGDRVAYIILQPNEKFWEDVKNKDMESVANKGKYLK